MVLQAAKPYYAVRFVQNFVRSIGYIFKRLIPNAQAAVSATKYAEVDQMVEAFQGNGIKL